MEQSQKEIVIASLLRVLLKLIRPLIVAVLLVAGVSWIFDINSPLIPLFVLVVWIQLI